MPGANSPMRLDAELTESARSTGQRMSRSTAQQIAHWARIGRELERGPSITLADVQAVLDGQSEYDSLNLHEQAVVRAEWASRIDQSRRGLRLDQVLAGQDREVVELASDGSVAVKGTRGTVSYTHLTLPTIYSV